MNKEKILSVRSELDIFQHYIPELTERHIRGKKNVLSRFKDERNPSMSVYRGRDGRLKFKCHTSGYQGDVFEFVARLHNLDSRSQFQQVLEVINRDLRLGLEESFHSPVWKAEYYDIFTRAALAFWEGRGVGESTLHRYNVRQLRALKYKEGKRFNYEQRKLIAFEFTVNGRKKLYVPKQPGIDKKYLCKTQVNSDIFGLAQLRKDRRLQFLLICEGESDALCAASHGIAAVSFQSASTIPTRGQVRRLKRYAAHLVSVYDNDEAGRKRAEELEESFGVVNYRLPEEYKDLSEYLPNANREDFIKRIQAAIQEHRQERRIHVWEHDFGYWKFNKDGETVPVSNFIIEVDAMVVREEGSYRLVRFRSEEFDTGMVAVDSKVFNSEQKFEDFVADLRGNFQFTGSKRDLQAIRKMSFGLCDYYEEVSILGWLPEYSAFLFSNAAIKDGQLLQPDDRGIIHQLGIYIPAASNEHRDNSDYESMRKIRFANGSHYQQPWQFFEMLAESYGAKRGAIGFAYVFAALFFDFVAREGNDGFFPHLGISGQRGSGKGSFTKMLMALFTHSPEETSLQNATSTGMIRLYEQKANIPIWLDEYKNTLPEKLIEGLKNLFDLIGKVTGVKSTDARTARSRILSPTILTGQEAPVNEALFSRCISVEFPPVVKDKEKIKRHLEHMSELHKGCGLILLELLSYRQLVVKHYSSYFYRLIDRFSDLVAQRGLLVNTRLIKNYASVFAPVLIAIDHGLMLVNPKEGASKEQLSELFLETAQQNLLVQATDEQQLDEVNQFLDLLMVLADKGEIKLGFDFLVDELQDEFVVKSSILEQFNRYYWQVYNCQGADWRAIDKYLKTKPFFKKKDRAYFKYYVTGPEGMVEKKKQLRGLFFHLSKLREDQREFFVSIYRGVGLPQ